MEFFINTNNDNRLFVQVWDNDEQTVEIEMQELKVKWTDTNGVIKTNRKWESTGSIWTTKHELEKILDHLNNPLQP